MSFSSQKNTQKKHKKKTQKSVATPQRVADHHVGTEIATVDEVLQEIFPRFGDGHSHAGQFPPLDLRPRAIHCPVIATLNYLIQPNHSCP